MDSNILLKPADSLDNTASAVRAIANSFPDKEIELSIAEKVRRIVEKLGRGETVKRIDVDDSAIDRWIKGGNMLKKNRRKIEALYKELFG